MGKITLVLGGARSGKSNFAEKIARETTGSVVYIATAQGLDDEMANRIKSHRQKRLDHWHTLEIPVNVGDSWLEMTLNADLVLLDCLTLLVSNILMKVPTFNGNYDYDKSAIPVKEEVEKICEVAEAGTADWLIVSNEVGLGLVPVNSMGRIYRDLLGWANQRVASSAQGVYLLVAGIPLKIK